MESKQDIFDELLDAFDEAVSGHPGALHPTAQLLTYADRYAAASDETEAQRKCPYCHMDDTQMGKEIQDGMDSMDILQSGGDYYMRYVRDAWSSVMVPIRFCPMCARRLGGEGK